MRHAGLEALELARIATEQQLSTWQPRKEEAYRVAVVRRNAGQLAASRRILAAELEREGRRRRRCVRIAAARRRVFGE